MENLEHLNTELHLTLGEVNLILGALSELPYKVSFSLIQKIKQQGEQQIAAAQNKLAEVGSPSKDGH